MTSGGGDKGRDFEPGAVPRRTEREARSLPIGALEAFVLGQVDGRLTLEEVAEAAGLAVPDTVRILVRLCEVGAVELPGRSRRKSSRSMRRPSKSALQKGHGPTRSLTSSVIPARARDLTGLATTAEEAFVVGQIDGVTSAGEIASLLGLPLEHVAGILAQLARAGAVVLADSKTRSRGAAPESKRALRPAGSVGTRRRSSAHHPAPRSLRTKPPAGAPSKGSVKPKATGSKPSIKPKPVTPAQRSAPPKPTLLAPVDDLETCELRPEVQKQVDELHARMRTASHYELLGVARGADKMTIKRAFYGLVAILHPDRHFNKKLGRFKTKINDVFLAVTAAHDVLSNPDKRASYDATLRASVPVRPPPPPPVPAPEPTPNAAPPWSGPRDKAVEAVVREAFAARLGGSARPSSVPPPPTAGVAPDGGASLKRFFDEKVGQAGRHKARVFVVAAEDAMARGDVVAAAQHYRLALQLHDTLEVRAALDAAESRGGDKMFDVHVRQGRSDERAGRWGGAAKRYERAYNLRGEAWLAERWANALRRSQGDLRQAVKLAEEAVTREPQNAGFRATLAEVCFDAGLLVRARAEAQRALAMAPGEERGRAVMAQVAKAAKAR